VTSLRQADVEALLGASRSSSEAESRPAGADRRERSSGTYDFGHPDLLSRDRIRALRTLHDGYAQALAKRLSTELLASVSATVTAVDQLTYGEFLMLLPAPTFLAVVDVCELDGAVAIEIDPSICFAFIDRLLGGPGAPLREPRPLTAIETGLMERVLRRSCQELDLAWAPVTRLQFRLQSIEASPELARVVAPSEMIALVTLGLAMNGLEGAMHVCLPYVVMEPALQRMARVTRYPRRAGGAPERVRDALEGALRSSRVTVDVDLGVVELTLREILALVPGEILPVTPIAGEGAAALVEGVPRLRGTPGRSRRRLAFEVRGVHSPGGGGERGGR
jgi:flagellar motor switch protein FliM